ncbi:MAG: iron chelate uptake ABC transporter family permease subunit [Cyclonatronaceae bacterium]
MSDAFLDFITLQNANLRWVLLGTVLLGLSAGALGCFTVLRQRALVGDAVAHSVLPGVCLAFIVMGDKNPIALLIGSVIFGWISLVVMDFLVRNTRISSDTSIGMVLSVFFGLGVMLLTYIQSSGNVNQSGLDAFLFGNAASMLREDVLLFGAISVMVLLALLFLFKELRLISFDPEYAQILGYPIRRMEIVLATLLVVTITAGLQAVGVVLMASMLIIPAATARYWTDSLAVMLAIAAAVGSISAISGTFVSYAFSGMPTGPWMVLTAATLFGFSFFLAPARGELQQWLRRRKQRRKINEENILKTLYKLEERDKNDTRVRPLQELLKLRRMKTRRLKAGLKSLKEQKFVEYYEGRPGGYILTQAGREQARRVVRVHRLWELYLTRQLEIAGDHVHDDAESMEHVITPELEQELLKMLDFPEKDPHEKSIPGFPS